MTGRLTNIRQLPRLQVPAAADGGQPKRHAPRSSSEATIATKQAPSPAPAPAAEAAGADGGEAALLKAESVSDFHRMRPI